MNGIQNQHIDVYRDMYKVYQVEFDLSLGYFTALAW